MILRWLLILVWLACGNVAAQGTYWQLQIRGAIGPGVATYLLDELDAAQVAPDRPELILLLLDTPGGLYAATLDINQALLASSIPVVTYVYPQGARAASAGTFILYASHVAAMAPVTHLGAATPVQIGGGGLPGTDKPQPDGTDKDSGTEPGRSAEQGKDTPTESPDSAPSDQGAMAHKQMNDAVAYIRSLAERYQRNADWAEQAVREAATLTAREALAENVVELVAEDVPDLLRQLDGREVRLAAGPRTLHTEGLTAVVRQPSLRHQFLSAITDPNIAYILMLIGIYGLLLEFYSPGFGVSGVLGAICLLLAMFALQMMPISYAGLSLLLLGVALLVAEAMVPSFGILGGGGVVAFVMGSILLFDTPVDAFRVAWPLIAALTVTSLLFLVIVLRLLTRQRRSPVVSGAESLRGKVVTAREDFRHSGRVMLGGEIWLAHSRQPVHKGEQLKVEAVDGLSLEVVPLPPDE